jgi:hypothetical protein
MFNRASSVWFAILTATSEWASSGMSNLAAATTADVSARFTQHKKF